VVHDSSAGSMPPLTPCARLSSSALTRRHCGTPNKINQSIDLFGRVALMSKNSGSNGSRTFVIGVGMTKFEKPGSKEWDYPDMAQEAGTKALEDAGISYDDVEQAYVGYCYGDSTAGQRAVYGLGLTGIPVVNVNNNCST